MIDTRTVTCVLPTSMLHWYNLGVDGDLAGAYSTLECVDWSFWSSANTANQEVFIRVWQDLTPATRGATCPNQGFGNASDPGPDAASAVLLWEGSTIFPPSTEGVNSLTTPRSDGDRSIRVGPDLEGEDGLGDGILFPPDIAFFVEIAHLGEAQNRFGSNLDGEAGDPNGPEVTWVRAPNCSGGACVTACAGVNCVGTDFAKHTEWAGNRDFVMIVHLNAGDTTPPPPLKFCPSDITGPGDAPDRVTNVTDLLALLASWGTLAPPRPLGDMAPPPNGDNLVNVTDLLVLLANWGECPNPNEACQDVVDNDLAGLPSPAIINADGTYDWVTNPDIHDGPLRGPTNDLAEVFRGPTTTFWANYGANGILDAYQFGDLFGIFMGVPAPGPFIFGGDVWFLYEASCDGKTFFLGDSDCAAGEVTDTQIEIYPYAGACPTDWADIIGWDEDGGGGCSGFHALASVNVNAGDKFLVRIGGWGGEAGEGRLVVTCVDNAACESALAGEVNGTVTGNTAGALNTDAPTCDGVDQVAGGRWYTVVGTGKTMTARTGDEFGGLSCEFDDLNCGDGTCSAFNSAISVFCGTADTICEDLTCVAAANGTDICNLHETVSWCSREGEVYYILVHGDDSGDPEIFPAEGFFVLEILSDDGGDDCTGAIQCGQARPSNDNCPNAITIPSGSDDDMDGIITVNQAINNVNATQDGHGSGACGNTGDDVWYLWTAPATALVSFSTCNQAFFDTRIEVHDNAVVDCPTTDDSALILCDNDTAGCAGFSFDTISGNIVGPDGGIVIFAGQTVLIKMGSPGFGVQEGAATLTITANLLPSSCPSVCPEGAISETGGVPGVDDEALLDDGDVDVTNGGCNMCVPAYTSITDDVVICGQASTYLTNADLNCDSSPDGVVLELRDTDWFEIVVPDTPDEFGSTRGSRFTLTMASEFASIFGVAGACAGGPDVETPFLASAITGGLCIENSLTVDLEAGTYSVVVTTFNTTGVEVGGDGVTHEGHDYVLTVGAFEPAQLPPLNDACADAIDIAPTSTTVVDQRFATNVPSDPDLSCSSLNGLANGSVWYTFTASDPTILIETCNSVVGADSNFGVFEWANSLAKCSTLSEIACSEDECSGSFLSTAVVNVNPGQEYYIQLGAWSAGDQSIYDLELTSPAP